MTTALIEPSLLLDRIHSTDRRILHSNLFAQRKTQICLLDFIGASQYFITDFGSVWVRDKIFPNKNHVLSQGWLPLVARDPTVPSPWVCLTTTVGKFWWPVNQLLGWAFRPYPEKIKKYYLALKPHLWGELYTQYDWKESLPDSMVQGAYASFINHIYGNA